MFNGLFQPPAGWRRLCLLAAVSAFSLGMVGLWQLSRSPGAGLSATDIAYGSLGLFFVQPPDLPNDVGLPISFEIARFLAPAATAYVLADTLVKPMAALQATLSRGHAVICGSGPTALAFAERLRAASRQVVLIDDVDSIEIAEHARRLGLVLLRGDARRGDVLRRAGVARADQLYVCGTASGYNAAVVAAAEQVSRQRHRPLTCYAEESDPDVLDALWTLLLGREHIGRLTVEFFNTARLGASLLLDDERIAFAPLGLSVVIVGMGPFGRELLLELARRRREVGATSRMQVTLIDKNASGVLRLLQTRYGLVEAMVDTICQDTGSDEVDLNGLLDGYAPEGAMQLVFICYEDEELALRKALAVSRLPGHRKVIVRVDRMTPFGQAFGSGDGARPLDILYRGLTVFPLLDRVCDPDQLQDPQVEQLAKGIHRDYCRRRMEAGERPEENRALVAWENLSEDFRNANYEQARDIRRKLDMIGCGIVAGAVRDDPFSFSVTDAQHNEVEILAKREHERWMVERQANGWRYGPHRDNDRKTHPMLVPWDDLDAPSREKDHETIRLIPMILAEAGFHIVRRRS
ncbi:MULTISPECIES: RyR domain-containing protein [unclassified Frankia]|uniref:RyR domain-containing protein n=1 Tax=unclassified Frankia TaxID=2632575 RepID=UPI00141B654C|nr:MULTISPECIES: RyR domain-containing protein [unclassified Frankia]